LAAKEGSARFHGVKKLGVPEVAQGAKHPFIGGIISYNASPLRTIAVESRVVVMKGPQRV